MNLLALNCTSCGSPLDFAGSSFSSCPACNTPFVLAGADGDLLQAFSYTPYVPRRDGKMDKCLKIQLAEKIRAEGLLVFNTDDDLDRSNRTMKLKDRTTLVYVTFKVSSDLEQKFSVADIFTDEDLLYYEDHAKTRPVMGTVERGIPMADIWVKQVEMVEGNKKILMGHRIVMGVRVPSMEDSVNALSIKIQEWFGVIPEVYLEKG